MPALVSNRFESLMSDCLEDSFTVNLTGIELIEEAFSSDESVKSVINMYSLKLLKSFLFKSTIQNFKGATGRFKKAVFFFFFA